MTIRRHFTEQGAKRQRNRLDRNVSRVATNGTYHVERGWLLWKVVKRWSQP